MKLQIPVQVPTSLVVVVVMTSYWPVNVGGKAVHHGSPKAADIPDDDPGSRSVTRTRRQTSDADHAHVLELLTGVLAHRLVTDDHHQPTAHPPTRLRRIESLLQAIIAPGGKLEEDGDSADEVIADQLPVIKSSTEQQHKLLEDIREFISKFDRDVEAKQQSSRYSQLADGSAVGLAKRGRYDMMGAMPPMIELCRMMGLTRCH